MNPLLLFSLAILSLLPRIDASDEGWLILFNGKDLDGWTEKTKDGSFRVEEGVIIRTIAIRSGKKVEYNPENMSFKDSSLDPYIKEPVRAGWEYGETL